MRINRDHEYLGKLRDYYAKHHVLPSFATIADLIGISTTSAVSAMVDRLKKKGYLESSPDRRLQPGRRFFETVLLDTVQAGRPETASENQSSGYDIVRHLLPSPSQSVMLKVKGESMLDAGLLPDDCVIVRRDLQAGIGDIVVARVDGEYTVKYLAEDDNGLYLRAGNKEYKDIRPSESLESQGL